MLIARNSYRGWLSAEKKMTQHRIDTQHNSLPLLTGFTLNKKYLFFQELLTKIQRSVGQLMETVMWVPPQTIVIIDALQSGELAVFDILCSRGGQTVIKSRPGTEPIQISTN